MADREFTVERLSLQLKEEGEGRKRTTSVVVSFTAERVTWQITLAKMAVEQIKVLFNQLNIAILSESREIRELVEERDLTVDLDPKLDVRRPTPITR